MNRARPKGRPTFFWQGTFILLPVTVLMVVALSSLRQDEQAAEQEARRRAAQNVDQLARAVRSQVNDDLDLFLGAQNGLTEEWPMMSAPGISHHTPDEGTKNAAAEWDAIYPELPVENLATSDGSLLTDGRLLEPAGFSSVPIPPSWYLKLIPKQQELWNALMNAWTKPQSARAIEGAYEAFAGAVDGVEARDAAVCLTQPLEKIAGSDASMPAADSGLLIQDLACYHLLRTNAPGKLNLIIGVVRKRVIDHPSFASPTLLEMAEARTNGADAATQRQVSRMRQRWNAQERAREWLSPLLEYPDLKAKWNWPTKCPTWTIGPSGAALVVLSPVTFEPGEALAVLNPPTDGAQGHNLQAQGYQAVIFPAPVMNAIFSRALVENHSLIPDFAAAVVKAEGRTIWKNKTTRDFSIDQPLASASVQFGTARIDNLYNSLTFQISFSLTSREQMLATERRREVRFGFLILLAAATALVGFFAARRAFYRQLRLSEMKSDFVSSVSHELRAPIASVRLMAEGLERGKIQEPAKQQEYFKFIVQECRRLSSLIENVLDFSRIEEGRKRYEMESTDLVALTEQTVKVMETYAAERDIRIALSVTGTPAPVDLDGKAIQQALVNLVDNAIKHSPKGAEIAVGVDFNPASTGVGAERNRHASTVLVSVEDHGEGIAQAEQERIFERFYRVGSELRRETQGVGIGLSIVKHIVEAHGGRVTVRSAPGQGSRFTIELPINGRDGPLGRPRTPQRGVPT
jgi:signal transduction histidine kinase